MVNAPSCCQAAKWGKFLNSNFTVMLFHYDGVADDWKELEWSVRGVHVSAFNQTKWWFAKRFLHPDIVAQYDYVFLWDEDLGVENFHPDRYISIIEEEGLKYLSQNLMLPNQRFIIKSLHVGGDRLFIGEHTSCMTQVKVATQRVWLLQAQAVYCAFLCSRWIEVFSRAAWRCVWYMIQNDLIQAWGLDMQLGYCAQGDQTKNVGIVDAESIVHYNRPTLGITSSDKLVTDLIERNISKPTALPMSMIHDPRVEVRRQSYIELELFRQRWKKVVEEDKCWTYPYPPAAE